LGRAETEGEKVILESAEKQATALAVSGDPMIATTHVSLVLSAKKRGIPVEIVHGASILSAAIGESGLQAYKFGKTVTLAYWRENYRPMAAYDVITENLSRNLHTLLLLDIDEKLGPMKPSEAAATLLAMEKEGGKGILKESTAVILLKGIGWMRGAGKYCGISALKEYDAADGPCVIIIPGRLHFLEDEFLAMI
jgi:diphthine synthase